MPTHRASLRYFLNVLPALSALMLLSGCQALFHASDAPFKNQPVTVAVSVPDTPPPAVAPVQLPDLPVAVPAKPKGALQKNLLPTSDLSVTDQAVGTVSTGVPKAPSARTVLTPRQPLTLADTVIKNKTLTQDLVLKGTVLIEGALIVPRQMTLRIEPGTVIRFMPATTDRSSGSVQIAGRLLAQGTAAKPILLTAAYSDAHAGDWDGIRIISSKKKNILSFCHIDGAVTGISARESKLTIKGGSISQCRDGMALIESTVVISNGLMLKRCDRGIVMQRGTVVIYDATVRENRLGLSAEQSSVTVQRSSISHNSQEGIVLNASRYMLEEVQLSQNRGGIVVTGGSGIMREGRITANREAGIALKDTTAEIEQLLITQVRGTALLLDNAQGRFYRSIVQHAGGAAVVARHSEQFDASGSYWGSDDPAQIHRGLAGDPPGPMEFRYQPYAVTPPFRVEP